MKIVNITIVGTGACNCGPGSWASILRYGENTLERVGGSQHTTKRRMELQAVIESLKALREPCHVLLGSDDQNLLDGIGYWRREWRPSVFTRLLERLPDPLPDGDLWLKLDTVANQHLIRGQHVDAILSHPDKRRCDELAEAQATLDLGAQQAQPE